MGVDSLLRTTAVSLIAAALVVPLLNGCAPGSAKAARPSPSPTESAEPTRPTGHPPLLDYESGAKLDPEEWSVGWHMLAMWTGGYSPGMSTGTTHAGLWTFTDDKSTCEISLTQTSTESGTDDKALSDAAILKDRDLPANAAANIYDSTTDITGQNRRVQFRSLVLTGTDGSSAAVLRRVFAPLHTALGLEVSCPAKVDAVASANSLLDHLTVDVRHTSDPVNFDESSTLYGSKQTTWSDESMTQGKDWTLTHPDSGEGYWTYTSADKACTAEFDQFRLESGDLTGDDRVATKHLLDAILAERSWNASAKAEGRLSFTYPYNDILPALIATGADGTTKWAAAARALEQSAYGFMIIVTCTTRNPLPVLQGLNEKAAIIPAK
ncbi:hypothetical protein [Microbacterium sp. NPDC057650]|uniref:hypothetical protein n=1 Tax=unclassified Microbacterium TaxID=2609290 RepID=UPI00366D97D4